MEIRIQTGLWDVTIEGTSRKSQWISADSPVPTRFAVRAAHDNVMGIWINGEQISHEGDVAIDGGPALFEETEYRLSIIGRNGNMPKLFHRDPALVKNVRPIFGTTSVLSGNINFRSQVGKTVFRVSAIESFLELEIEVLPAKLDYRHDYQDLVEDVSSLCRQLVLEYLRATTSRASLRSDDDRKNVEWLLILRSEFDSLIAALRYISQSPHTTIVRETSMRELAKVRRITGPTRRALIRGLGQGDWTFSPGIGTHRRFVPNERTLDSQDSSENKWISLQLRQLILKLTALNEQFENTAYRSSSNGSLLRRRRISDELTGMSRQLLEFTSKKPFDQPTDQFDLGFSSLALQGRPGYREAHQSILKLRMSLVASGDSLEIPLSDLSELYEIWCFIATVKILSELLEVPIGVEELVELRDTGFSIKLAPGKRSSVVLKKGEMSVKVSYNLSFSMLSGIQRPDIVIEIRRVDVAPVLLLLDAKYRLKTDDDYLAMYGCPGPPVDAIGQLHRYRDAIIVKYPGHSAGRPVVRALALFPLGVEDSREWDNHQFARSIDQVGIGAVPFLPSNTSWLRSWLKQALRASPQTLAWPGPEFLAWKRFS